MNNFFKRKIFRIELFRLRRAIHNPNDKVLFDEAVKCVSQKAYRAGYIIVWICAAESLRAKIVELALKDTDAGRALKEIQKCEQQSFSPDKLILDRAESLGILDKDEYKKLEHIRDMRNSYAHPTGNAPTLSELESAFQQICSYILNRPAQLKYGYVTNLINSIFSNRHFLDDDDEKVSEYAVGIAHRLHPEVVPFLVRKACEEYDKNTEGIIRRRAVYFVTSLLRELRPDLKADQWGIIAILDQHSRAASLFFSIPEIWDSMPTQAQDMCFGNLAEPSKPDGTIVNPSPVRIRRLQTLRAGGCLSERQETKFEEILNKVPYESLVTAGVGLKEMTPRIIAELKSHNWYKQNPAVDAINNFGLTAITNLAASQQEDLGRNILQAAEGGSGSARNFLMEAAKEKKLPEAFVSGILKECFTNEKMEFRLKVSVLNEVLSIAAFQDDFESIVAKAVEDIKKSTPGFSFASTNITEVVVIIDTMLTTSSAQDLVVLKSLRKVLVDSKPRLDQLYAKQFED